MAAPLNRQALLSRIAGKLTGGTKTTTTTGKTSAPVAGKTGTVLSVVRQTAVAPKATTAAAPGDKQGVAVFRKLTGNQGPMTSNEAAQAQLLADKIKAQSGELNPALEPTAQHTQGFTSTIEIASSSQQQGATNILGSRVPILPDNAAAISDSEILPTGFAAKFSTTVSRNQGDKRFKHMTLVEALKFYFNGNLLTDEQIIRLLLSGSYLAFFRGGAEVGNRVRLMDVPHVVRSVDSNGVIYTVSDTMTDKDALYRFSKVLTMGTNEDVAITLIPADGLVTVFNAAISANKWCSWTFQFFGKDYAEKRIAV